MSLEDMKHVPGNDPLIELLKELGQPVTRENYLAWAYPDGIPNPWTAELEAELPEELQHSGS